MIVSRRLKIRPITSDDLPQVIVIHSDPLVNEFLPYETWQNQSDADAWFERIEQLSIEGKAKQYVIELLENQKVIGTCMLINYDLKQHRAEIGYVLNRDYWRKGLMFEAMTLFIEYLQFKLKVQTIQATVEVENIASIKLLEKLKFNSLKQDAEHKEENIISYILS